MHARKYRPTQNALADLKRESNNQPNLDELFKSEGNYFSVNRNHQPGEASNPNIPSVTALEREVAAASQGRKLPGQQRNEGQKKGRRGRSR